MPINHATRNLTGKIRYVRARMPEGGERNDPRVIAIHVAGTFYSHLMIDGNFQPHNAVALPNIREVRTALRKIVREDAGIVRVAAPPVPYYNSDDRY